MSDGVLGVWERGVKYKNFLGSLCFAMSATSHTATCLRIINIYAYVIDFAVASYFVYWLHSFRTLLTSNDSQKQINRGYYKQLR